MAAVWREEASYIMVYQLYKNWASQIFYEDYKIPEGVC